MRPSPIVARGDLAEGGGERARVRQPDDAEHVVGPVVGRGHVSLLTNLDTWQCKPFRGMRNLLRYSPT
jgi:hypothetical protein